METRDKQIHIPDIQHMPRVVIVGGGFGGVQLAKSLKKKSFQVVLLDKHNYHTFQPLLYQVATAGLEADAIATPFREIFKKQDNFYFRLAEVQAVDVQNKSISTTIGPLTYDYLVLACGAQPNFFDNEELANDGLTMKSLVQSLDIRTRLIGNCELALQHKDEAERQHYLNVVIAGGGPTGVELAGAIAELRDRVLIHDYPELSIRDMRILLVHGGNRLLPTMEEVSSRKAHKFLSKLGVEVMLERLVAKETPEGILLNDESLLPSKTLLWTAGVKGVCLPGIMEECVSNGFRYLVDKYNQLMDHENIFVIGDLAKMVSEEYPKGHPGLAPVAIQQGKQLAKNFDNIRKELPLKPFKYVNKGVMATVGKNRAVVELSNGWNNQGVFAWFVWMGVHLLLLVGFKSKIVTFINWAVSYFNYSRSSRLITRPFTSAMEKFVQDEKIILTKN